MTLHPASAGELVHQPARDPYVNVFCPLADLRQLEPIHLPAADSLPECCEAHFHRSRRAQTGSNWDIRAINRLDAACLQSGLLQRPGDPGGITRPTRQWPALTIDFFRQICQAEINLLVQVYCQQS